MAIIGNQITVTTSTGSPTLLVAPGGTVADTVPITLINQGSASVYLNGSATVGSSSTYELAAGGAMNLSVFGGDILRAWTPTAGGIRVDVLLGRQ